MTILLRHTQEEELHMDGNADMTPEIGICGSFIYGKRGKAYAR